MNNKLSNINVFNNFMFLIPFLILYFLGLKIEESRYLLFSSLLLWLFSSMIINSNKLIKSFDLKYTMLYLFFMYLILFSYNGNLISTIKVIGTICVSFSPVYLFDYYFKNSSSIERKKYSKLFLQTISMILVYLVFANLYYVIQNPMVARYLTSYDPSNTSGFGHDLPKAIGGGYQLAYGIIIIPPFIMYIMKNIENRLKYKIVLLLLFIFLNYFILKLNFTIALMLSLTFSLIMFLSNGKKAQDLFYLLLGGMVSFLLILLNAEALSKIISSISTLFSTQGVIYLRLNQLSEYLLGSSNDSSVLYRVENIEKSINTFLEFPLAGASHLGGYNFTQEAQFVGQHSEWVDIMARYGILGGVPLLIFIFISLRELYYFYESTIMPSVLLLITAMVIILGFLNPFLSSTLLMFLFIFIPSWIEQYIKVNQKE